MSGGEKPCHHIASAADVNVPALSERVCAAQHFFFPIVKAKIGAILRINIVGVCVTSGVTPTVLLSLTAETF